MNKYRLLKYSNKNNNKYKSFIKSLIKINTY